MGYQRDQSNRRIDGMNREEICRRYQAKVVLLARRMHERVSGDLRAGIDDLAAEGAIGLLEAFDRFDPTRGIQFGTYAEYRIRGAMYDALRDGDAVGRRRRQLARRIQAAADTIRATELREPAPMEVADALGIDLDAYHAAVDRSKPVVHVAFDSPIHGDRGGRTFAESLAERGPTHESVLVAAEIRVALKTAVQALPTRQREAVLMYYGSELNLAEIAQVFGVTTSRVSQILTEARERLRRALAGTVDESDFVAAP